MAKHNHNIKKSITYVNFAPYENAGNILDYLLDTFDLVVLFCFNFHKLTRKKEPSLLKIYKNKKIIGTYPLFYLPTTRNLAFILLPIRSGIIFLQVLFYSIFLFQEFGRIDVYFTVNAFTAWCGNILRGLGLVNKTVFWVWDYYPLKHKSKLTVFMRWLYWIFDKPATLESNKVAYLNKNLVALRKKMGIQTNPTSPIVPIGTNPIHSVKKNTTLSPMSLVFLGVLKRSHGLDLLYDSASQIMKMYPDSIIHIIGSGPDREYFENRARVEGLKTVFHGYVSDDKEVDAIIGNAHIGIATYAPEEGSVTYYTDPSKIKRYIAQGLPVVTTNVVNFARTLEEAHAGIVIPYEPKSLIRSIGEIIKNYDDFSQNSLALAKNLHYKTIYKLLFA